jgi:hypothetical protein
MSGMGRYGGNIEDYIKYKFRLSNKKIYTAANPRFTVERCVLTIPYDEPNKLDSSMTSILDSLFLPFRIGVDAWFMSESTKIEGL